MEENRLKGVIDLHIHSGPDLRERRLDDLQLMEAAVERGIRAIVIKSHHVPTVDRAALVNRVKQQRYGAASDFQMFGGVALNRFIGGINPWAVETALKLGGKMVWMPTITSENHCRKEGKDQGVVCVRDGKIVDALKTVFTLIRDFDAVLETGHISPEECFLVTEAARDAGVKKIVITHPEFHMVGMSLEDQKRIVRDYGVLLERVYAQPVGGGVYKKNLPDNVAAMREIGCCHFIVATDGGQMQNPKWYDTIREYVDYLYEAGFSREEIDWMTRINPGNMLGIAGEPKNSQ
ncbi:MAG: hypothetical protein HFG62_01210 [Lachnospiraceae bacterium]|jgi:hypothetical protein|nr:hypothetical protein [Lachnospiraceae bacterium]MCI8957743.1 hypothetical protein [Lachnospiraceae bacterium]